LAEGAFTTNCLGQPSPSFVRPGETVAVLLTIGYNDNCVGNLSSGANDESLMTNIIDVVDFGTSKVTNSIPLNPPILLHRGDPDVAIVNISSGPFSGAAYLVTVPLNATKEIHSSISHGVDTNSICNPGGDVGGIGSVQLTVIRPAITVTKRCLTAVNPAGNAVIVTFSGTVSNSGDAALSGIVVVNNQPGPNTTVFTTATLAVGQSITFTNSYTNTVNVCGPFTDTLTATAVDVLQCPVTSSSTDTCTITYTPSISVTKLCPATNGLPGGILTFSGTVCNTGNIALTNVTVLDNVVLTGGNNVVATYPLLTNGECRTFTGTIAIPANVCSISDTLTARGTNICTGVGVVATVTTNCPVSCAPEIKVYKQVVCYSNQCEPFSSNLDSQKTATGVRVDPSNVANCPAFCYRITVTNSGNVALSNVTVIDDSIPNPDLDLSACGFPTTLPVGGSASCIVQSVSHCSNTVNIVTATGTGQTPSGSTTVSAKDTNTVTVVPISVMCQFQILTNGVVVPGSCPKFVLNTSYTVRLLVKNNGQYALQNVTVANVAGLCFSGLTNIGSLAVDETKTIDCNNLCTVQSSNYFAASVAAEASQSGGKICAYNTAGQLIRTTSSCSGCVECAGQPRICVTKEVACELPTGCGTYSDVATGAKTADNSQCPSFCYRVRVTNCGEEALNNVTVVDNVLSLAGCNFPTSLALGQTAECIVAGVEHCQSVTNTVTASGVGASSGTRVSTNDTAAVVVLPISITCNVTVNGKPEETIPCDGQGHMITNAVEVCNTGSLPLSDITINAPDIVALGDACTNVANLRLSLLPGQCTNVALCIDIVTCPPDCSLAFSNHIRITATVDQTLTNVCSWTRNESNQVVAITASTECSAVVKCLPPPKTGCTPGFWKNCTIHWQPTGYRTDQSVSSVFSLGTCCTSLGNLSLMGALNLGGGSGVCGGAQNLLRAAVAALLNASSPELDYPFTEQQVITMVSAALQSCDRGTMIALASELDRDNNLGCGNANGGLPCHRLSDVPRIAPTRVTDDARVAPTRQ